MKNICIIAPQNYKIPVSTDYVTSDESHIRFDMKGDKADKDFIHMDIVDYSYDYFSRTLPNICIYGNEGDHDGNIIMNFNKKKIKDSEFIMIAPECVYSYLHGIALTYNKPIFIIPNEYDNRYSHLNTAHMGYEIERKWLISSRAAEAIITSSAVTAIHEITQFVDNRGIRYRKSVVKSNINHSQSVTYVKCFKGDTDNPVIRTEFEYHCTDTEYNKAYKQFKANKQFSNPVKKTRYYITLSTGDKIELNYIYLANKYKFINVEIEYDSIKDSTNTDLKELFISNVIPAVSTDIFEFTEDKSISNKTLMKLNHKSSAFKTFCKYVNDRCQGCLIKK